MKNKLGEVLHTVLSNKYEQQEVQVDLCEDEGGLVYDVTIDKNEHHLLAVDDDGNWNDVKEGHTILSEMLGALIEAKTM